MASGFSRHLLVLALLWLALFSSAAPASAQTPGMDPTQLADLATLQYGSATVEIHLKEASGASIEKEAIVTLTRPTGQFFNRANSKAGLVKFDRVPASEFNIQVIAAGYETAEKRIDVKNLTGGVIVDIEMTRLSAEDAAASTGFYALPPKVQKDVGKALAALRANKPNDALHPLQAAQKNAPNNAEIEYLLGLYSSQVKQDDQARAHWMKALESNPKHLGSLLAVSGDLVQQKKSAEALPYATRATEAEPDSWRAHILLAEALVMEKRNDDAVRESRRAIDLGHERAATAQLVLAHALAQSGNRDGAIQALEIYIKGHPTDASAAKDLETLKNPAVATTSVGADASAGLNAAAEDAAALPMATNWRPADVDDHVPSVETGAVCVVDDVVRKAGQRLTELVTDVDRFAATESLTHENINKWGVPSAPEKRKFDYVVSIQDLDHKYLNVEEYRNSGTVSAGDFPEGVATNGLPALVLIFHPYNAPNFAMSCEGLARLSSGLAWQVHFKQRPDKPNLIKRYRVGADGPSYPVALKGRVWISADTYQIVRFESDIVTPIPEIKLAGDHTEIEYGPVQFQGGKINMWLPQSADIYYDWRGRRIHRRHSYSNYMLFGVEEKQKISVPKVDDSTADSAPATPNKKP
jgi:tetratricopeptide (TPR) repeat protein